MKVLTKVEIQGCVCLGVCVCVKARFSFSNAGSHSEVLHFPGGGEEEQSSCEEQSRSSLDVVVNGLIFSL